MELHDAMYLFEHAMTPRIFWQDPVAFIAAIIEDKDILYRIMLDAFQSVEVECPYVEEDIQIATYKLSEKVFCLEIRFPKPQSEPLCYQSRILFSEDDHFIYFCTERGQEEDTPPYICSWEGEEHQNYGQFSGSTVEEITYCEDIFNKRFYPDKGGDG